MLRKVIKLIRQSSIFLLKNFKLTLFLYNSFFRIINKRRFLKEIKLRKNLSIFDYERLASSLPYYPIESTKDSNYYGHMHCLKEFAQLKKINHSIEHGLYLGNYVPKATYYKTIQSIITFSENRKQHLTDSKINKNIITIGPYIHYAQPILNEHDLEDIKKKCGKTLLLFPSHSIKNSSVEIDIKELIIKVNDIGKNYDTTMVCLYYKDIIEGKYPKYFIDAGYKIVTAGNNLDLNFLSRLKSIIQLSDITLSNTVGTHTGYCFYLDKPHYIIKQKIRETKKNGSQPDKYRNDSQMKSLNMEKKEIMEAFSIFSLEKTEFQKKIVNKYWGISSIRSQEELKSLLSQ